jgi:hypothetical protein
MGGFALDHAGDLGPPFLCISGLAGKMKSLLSLFALFSQQLTS